MKEFFNIFKNVLVNKYALFTGRATRKEFWIYILVAFGISIVFMLIEGFLKTHGILGTIFTLAILIPSTAILIRRLHDTNRSGWWALLMIVPLAQIVTIVFLCFQGTVGDNQFGSEPKQIL